MGFFKFIFFLSLSWSYLFNLAFSQLQASQSQILLQLKKHLEYPKQLDFWYDHNTNFCFLQQTPSTNITCFSNSVTELNIIGDKSSQNLQKFNGFAIPNITLSQKFSIDSFITTLSRLKTLKTLTLSSLGIWGNLPEKLHRLSSLEYLDLSNNFLFGSIPPKLSTLVKVETFRFDHNFFNGTFPTWFESFSSLKVVNFKSNKLFGELDSSLLSLPAIEFIDLGSNSLTGSLPNDLKCGRKLWFFDVSDNKLTGKVPNCLRNRNLVVKFNGNCFDLVKEQHKKGYCVKEVHEDEVAEVKDGLRERKGKNGALAGLIAGVSMAVLVVICGVFILFRRSKVSKRSMKNKTVQDNHHLPIGFSSEILSNARYVSETSKYDSEDLPVCRQFTLEEIIKATKNFDKSLIMGQNSSYGILYKGNLENGTKVAIRCLPSSKKYSIRNLKLRLDLLAKLRHPNLVCLLGHCIDCGTKDDYSVEKVFLIYEYIPNGNFQDSVSDDDGSGKVMNWSERLNVLTGVAKAVHFLHTGVIPGFYSNRLKINNVLLNQHRFAKLSDYGLSIVSEATRHHNNTEAAKSWQMSRLEDDVYSFGLILLQSIVGSSISTTEEEFLRDELLSLESEEGRRRMVNSTVRGTSKNGSLSRVISLMNKCVSPESLSRPSFEDILWNLQYASQLQSAPASDSHDSHHY